MRKLLVVAVALLALASPALADITLRPGIVFMGSTVPAVTVETLVQDTISAKFFVRTGESPGFIASIRQWPEPASFDLTGNSLPTYVGVGVLTASDDGQFVAGLYAEAGFRMAQMFDIGFAVEHAGATGRIELNFGISFDFTVPGLSEPEPEGQL